MPIEFGRKHGNELQGIKDDPSVLQKILVPIYENIIKILNEIRVLMDENPPKAKQKLTNYSKIYWNELKGVYEL